MVALVLRFATAVIAATTALQATALAQERAPSSWYEVDLVAGPGDGALAPSSGLPLGTLVEDLAASRFDGAVLWIPPTKGSKLPHEPNAQRVEDDATLEPQVDPVVKLLRDKGLAVAVGLVDPVDAGAAAGAATFRSIRIEGSAATSELIRIGRPALRDLLWCGPLSFLSLAVRTNAPGFAVSERLVNSLPPELRATQSRLDLLAFGAPPADALAGLDKEAFERVVAQSQLASGVALQLAGSTPERFDPFHNAWVGVAPPGLPRALRRAPPWLDLEESLLSPGAFEPRPHRRPLLGDAEKPGAVPLDPSAASATPRDPAAGTAAPAAPAGLLTPAELAGFTRLFALRSDAIAALGRFLLTGDAAARDEVTSKLAQCEALVPTLGRFAAEWQRGLADDRALVKGLEAWRVTTTTWKLSLADREGSELEFVAHAIDDERAHGFEEAAAESIGGERLRLSREVALDPDHLLILRSEVALIDPRAARLEISGGGRFTVLVNGVEQLTKFDALAQPLVTTLPLAAGKNVVELQLAPDVAGSDPRIHLALLPHHIEGITLEPRRALRTAEPVVRLRDPGALADESLVWPPGRTVGSSESGSAEFPFEPTWPGRTDVWLHAVLGATAPGRLDVAIDDGPAQALAIPVSARWQWLRLPAPLSAPPGPHRLVLTFRSPGTRIDAVTLFESGISFPHPPAGEGTLADAAWRFDPLGAGLVVDLPPLATGDLFSQSLPIDKSSNFQVFVWLRGRDPIPPGETAELDLTSASTRMRFVVPAGTPSEEWISVGTVNLVANERVELRARGRGGLTRVALLR